ncbi:MAG: 3-isopropylmalate dehydratase small subunit [Alphaproteobacteria bacterium]|nr:3-isopropylmalate dehydratase small subunit [Alphaproteobacteria bacterium]
MDKFTTLTGIAASLPIINIDTDQIIPARYLTTIGRTGLGRGLFHSMRYEDNGSNKPGFVLNRAPYDKAKILVAGENFGCGSSREHAPWALMDFGISCVIAPSFADIFFNNCVKNGILLITLPQATVEALQADAADPARATLSVDLPKQEIRRADGSVIAFEIDAARKHRLLNGLDDIGLTLEKSSAISSFEAKQRAAQPWLYR